jgi:hypothetical protein
MRQELRTPKRVDAKFVNEAAAVGATTCASG